MTLNIRFPIGTTFKTPGKHPRLCTVIDIWRTYDAANTLVRLRYVAAHEFAGQTIRDVDIVDATIARGLVSTPQEG